MKNPQNNKHIELNWYALRNHPIYVNSEIGELPLTETFDLIQESFDWSDYDTEVYQAVVEALDLEFNFHPTEEDPDVDWEIFWNTEVVPAVEALKAELA